VEPPITLGFYENFPENVHRITRFSASVSSKRLQQALLRIICETNSKTLKLEDITHPSIPKCTVILEWGIAEANDFSYLDAEETNKVLKVIQKKPFQTTDLFCVIRYYKTQNEKRTPLKFDYYMVRLTFNKNSVETQIFHEKGPRYITPEDLTDFIANKINNALSKRALKL